jgi:hypothetical protein
MRFLRRLPVPSRSLAVAVLSAALLALAPAPRAVAATLLLAGPAGANVSLNGSFIGFLPLAEPLTLPPGAYDLVCEMPGRIPHRQHLELGRDDDRRTVTVRLLPYSRRTAVMSNVALAGLGPRYLGHGTRGLIYSAVETGGLLVALSSELNRSNSQKEYLLAMDAYRQAVNANDIATLRAAADAKYQDTKNAANRRDLGLTAAIGAVVVSMIDSWLSFDGVAAGAGDLPANGGARVSAAMDAAGPMDAAGAPAFHSAVRLSF